MNMIMNIIRMFTSIWELYSPQMCDHIPPLLHQGWCNKGRGYHKQPEERQDIDKTYLWKHHLFLRGEDDNFWVIYLLCWKVYLERSYTHSHSAPQSEQKERVKVSRSWAPLFFSCCRRLKELSYRFIGVAVIVRAPGQHFAHVYVALVSKSKLRRSLSCFVVGITNNIVSRHDNYLLYC